MQYWHLVYNRAGGNVFNDDLKDFHQNWWDKKVVPGVTWNYLILAGIGIALILAYNSLDWDWVSGLRP